MDDQKEKTKFGDEAFEEAAREFDEALQELVDAAWQAGYMTAPVSFREKVRFFSLAPRAPSIHDPNRKWGDPICCDAQQLPLMW
jgi:hypothetical protein